MLELGTEQGSVRAAVDGAMLAEMPAAQAGEAEFPAMLTQSMIAIWHKFLEHRDLMRFLVEVKKSFAEGIWRRQ